MSAGGEYIYVLKGEIRHNITSLTFNEQTRLYDVLFETGAHYSYSPFFVEVLPLKKNFNGAATVADRKYGTVFNVTHISAYKNSKYTVCRLFYEKDGKEQSCYRFLKDIDIELGISDRKSKNVLEYLSEVANHSIIPLDEGQELSLGQKYIQLGMVYERSVLASYLNPESYENNANYDGLLIFPFGCNSSQYKAVTAALNNKLSIIQGPPGTGKTQTILNIMANLLLAGKTMQIVSNNNSAVENVRDKLAQPRYGFDFLVAQLGRKANKETFIAGQTGEYPQIDEWRISSERKAEIAKQLPHLTEQLLQLYARKERLAMVEQELMEHEVQKSHLQIPDDIICPKSLTSDIALELMNRCTFDFERKGKLGLPVRLRLWLKRIRKRDDVSEYLQAAYFVLKIAELQNEKMQLQEALQEMGSLQKQQEQMSLEYLRGVLESRYSKRENRRVFALTELRTASVEFLKEYPIVLSTTFSASGNIGMRTRFDYLIMDEASQVDVASGALALNSAAHAVIAGDMMQLPNVITDDKRQEINRIHVKYKIASAYHFTENSFMESICKLFPDVPNTWLREHYRCHPLIIGFCNRQFYDNELIPMKIGSNTDNALTLCMTSAGYLAHDMSNLISDTVTLSDEESRYAGHSGTHLDFLIYNTVTRTPLFAVEVDGYTFHNERTEQASRDRLKDSIMSKIGLRLERFRTDGSGEKERLAAILNNSR